MSIMNSPTLATHAPCDLGFVVSSECTSAVMRSARQDSVLMHALESADGMAMFGLMQSDWRRILAAHPEFADEMDSADPYVCDLVTLAELIAQAPTSSIRQALRETAYCREQLALMLDLQQPETDERARVVIAGANAEWEILLSAHPVFEACLDNLDRFTCSRAALVDAILLAPTETLRHALRETFCFREVASLITGHIFA
jgi:hypothetical protein